MKKVIELALVSVAAVGIIIGAVNFTESAGPTNPVNDRIVPLSGPTNPIND